MASNTAAGAEEKNNASDGRVWGTEITADCDVYEGEFKNDIRDGKGTYKWREGDSYEGDWKDGVRDGYGVYKRATGSTYEGHWKNGNQEGHGVMRYADGYVFEGEWVHGVKNGMGTEIFPTGTTCQGEWRDDVLVGQAFFCYNSPDLNGMTFKGYIKARFRTGEGIYTWADGSKFECHWDQDQADPARPNGIHTSADGNIITTCTWKPVARSVTSMYPVFHGKGFRIDMTTAERTPVEFSEGELVTSPPSTTTPLTDNQS
ncbi:morn repeat protein [Pelomyxa schiedti]|nr:morn repeat protein [Pelomyxa schiedti]